MRGVAHAVRGKGPSVRCPHPQFPSLIRSQLLTTRRTSQSTSTGHSRVIFDCPRAVARCTPESSCFPVSEARRFFQPILQGLPRLAPPDRIWIRGVVRSPSKPIPPLNPGGFGTDPPDPACTRLAAASRIPIWRLTSVYLRRSSLSHSLQMARMRRKRSRAWLEAAKARFAHDKRGNDWCSSADRRYEHGQSDCWWLRGFATGSSAESPA